MKQKRFLAIVLLVAIFMTAFASVSFAAEKKGTGLYKDNGQWKYFENGKFTQATGLVQKPNNGTWHYVEKGVYKKATGLVQCVQPGSSKGKWYFVKKGDLDKGACGLVQCIQPGKSKGKWYYVRNGKQKASTGLTKCIQPGSSYGNTYLVQNGKKSGFYGFWYEKGKHYYIKNGKWMSSYNGNLSYDGINYAVIDGFAYYITYFNLVKPGQKFKSPIPAYIYGKNIKMRYGPSEDYGVVATLRDGTAIEECGYNSNNNDWGYFSCNGQYGWIKVTETRFA